jgi:hypothetical protein
MLTGDATEEWSMFGKTMVTTIFGMWVLPYWPDSE